MSTEEIIHQIESRDRKYRAWQRVSGAALLLGVLLIIGLQASTIQKQNRTLTAVGKQLSQQKSTTEALATQSNEQRDKIIRRLDCMTAFFSQKNRASLVITDVDKCALDRDTPIDHFFPTTTNTTAPAASTQPTAQPSSPSQTTPVQNTPTPSTPPAPQPDNDGFIIQVPLLPKIHLPSPL